MPKAKSTQARLIAMSGHDTGKGKSSPPSDFISKMLHHPDPAAAAHIVGEQAGLEFDQGQGAQIEQISLKQQDLDAQYKTSKAKLELYEDKVKNTKQYLKSAALHVQDEHKNVTFSSWRTKDKVAMAFLAPALIVVLIMGAANVFANLMASGDPVFIERPWLAIFLSMLVPAGSVSLKFISGFFDYDQTKKRYALSIYIATALTLFAWSIAFAMNFSGITGGINWESMGDESQKGVVLVWLQLAAEILIGGALFLAAEEIYSKYDPETQIENPEWINADKALKKHLAEHNILRDLRGENHAQLVQLNAARQAFINEHIADFTDRHARLHAINNF